MGLIHKAAFCGDCAKRVIRHQHEALSALDASANDILMGRTAKDFFECAFQAKGAEVYDPSQMHHFDAGMQIYRDIPLDAPCLPWRQGTARAANRDPFRKLDRSGWIRGRAGLHHRCSPISMR